MAANSFSVNKSVESSDNANNGSSPDGQSNASNSISEKESNILAGTTIQVEQWVSDEVLKQSQHNVNMQERHLHRESLALEASRYVKNVFLFGAANYHEHYDHRESDYFLEAKSFFEGYMSQYEGELLKLAKEGSISIEDRIKAIQEFIQKLKQTAKPYDRYEEDAFPLSPERKKLLSAAIAEYLQNKILGEVKFSLDLPSLKHQADVATLFGVGDFQQQCAVGLMYLLKKHHKDASIFPIGLYYPLQNQVIDSRYPVVQKKLNYLNTYCCVAFSFDTKDRQQGIADVFMCDFLREIFESYYNIKQHSYFPREITKRFSPEKSLMKIVARNGLSNEEHKMLFDKPSLPDMLNRPLVLQWVNEIYQVITGEALGLTKEAQMFDPSEAFKGGVSKPLLLSGALDSSKEGSKDASKPASSNKPDENDANAAAVSEPQKVEKPKNGAQA